MSPLNAANSPNDMGLIGGRNRKRSTSSIAIPRRIAIISLMVEPQNRPWHGPIPHRE
jgi:hypothetical protein